MARTALLWTCVLLAGLAALRLLVLRLEPRLAFYPVRGVTSTPRHLGLEHRDLRIATADGETLAAWWIPHPSPRAEVVFFHGNGGNLSLWLEVLAALQAQGLSVLAPDYRGYGASSGRPTERGLYRDAEATVRALREGLHAPGTPIVYWGRSLGAAAAAHAAAVSPPDGVVLEGGFPDARALLRSDPLLAFLALFSSYRFPTADLLRGYRGPALVLHAERDEVVPLALGRALFDALSGPKRWVVIPGGGHNDLLAPHAPAWRAVRAFLADLPRETGR